jgi:hypothetical protein
LTKILIYLSIINSDYTWMKIKIFLVALLFAVSSVYLQRPLIMSGHPFLRVAGFLYQSFLFEVWLNRRLGTFKVFIKVHGFVRTALFKNIGPE